MRPSSIRSRHRWFVMMAATLLVVSGCAAAGGERVATGRGEGVPTSPGLSARTETLPTVTVSVDPRNPVAKAIRGGSTATPEQKADPAPVGGTVNYGDGVSVSVLKVDLAVEEAQGAGTFPGRAYAVFNIGVTNGSANPIPLDSVVVTVLDRTNHPVDPVYAQSAGVVDFGETLYPGESAEAHYAFAVPAVSRDKVTVVVDFDSVHSSAVFSGEIS